jgi:hypothetical protein
MKCRAVLGLAFAPVVESGSGDDRPNPEQPWRPGEHDTPDRLLIPEKLYGRAREVETLLASFDRIVKSGASELVLVSGYSGVGKSSVVHELHKVLVPPRGLFAAGKFDQYKRDIPYATLAQACQSLVRPLTNEMLKRMNMEQDRIGGRSSSLKRKPEPA